MDGMEIIVIFDVIGVVVILDFVGMLDGKVFIIMVEYEYSLSGL